MGGAELAPAEGPSLGASLEESSLRIEVPLIGSG